MMNSTPTKSFHHVVLCRQGPDVPSDERYQKLATFTHDQLGEALDSAGRIADAFVRMINFRSNNEETKLFHTSSRSFLIATGPLATDRKLAYVHVHTTTEEV